MGRLRSFFRLKSADAHTSGLAQINHNAAVGIGGGVVPRPMVAPSTASLLQHVQYKDSLVAVGYREQAVENKVTVEEPYMRNERLRGRRPRPTSRIDMVNPTRQGYNAANSPAARLTAPQRPSRATFVEPPSRGYNPYQ